jgi:hypothetical protein
MSAVRLTLTEYDIGSERWRTLQRLARQRRRSRLEDQVITLILFALDQANAGVDVEPSAESLDALELALGV